MDHMKEVILKGKIMALEAASMSDVLPVEDARKEAALLLVEAGGEITRELKERLMLLITPHGSALRQ